jgi:hypothetical protein
MTDKTIYNFSMGNFDIAVFLDYTFKKKDPEVWNNLDQYVDLLVTQNVYYWTKDPVTGDAIFNKKKNRANLIPCVAPRMLQNNVTKDYLGIRTNYLCPDKVDFFT